MTQQQPALPEEGDEMADDPPVNHRSTLLARLFRMNVANLSAVDKAAAAASAQWPLQVGLGLRVEGMKVCTLITVLYMMLIRLHDNLIGCL